jgi:dihydroxy-acid dehydratase
MNGTAFGTIVLHVTPDAASGGPLALVREGDRIRLSVRDRRIDLLVEEAELNRRRTARTRLREPLRARDSRSGRGLRFRILAAAGRCGP